MSANSGENYSLDNAMRKLRRIGEIISEDSKEYYLKKPSDVNDNVLKDISLSFVTLSSLIQEFADQWFSSKYKGVDAIQSSENLKERVDIKLFDTGKLDFKQMKKIMVRMNRIDDGLWGLYRIDFYLRYYEDLCNKKKLTDYANLAELFRTSSIDAAKETLTTEEKRWRNQIERCNLYYQPAIKTKTLNVALIALAISTLSVLITILNAVNII
jgi:hypothetical protein